MRNPRSLSLSSLSTVPLLDREKDGNGCDFTMLFEVRLDVLGDDFDAVQ